MSFENMFEELRKEFLELRKSERIKIRDVKKLIRRLVLLRDDVNCYINRNWLRKESYGEGIDYRVIFYYEKCEEYKNKIIQV